MIKNMKIRNLIYAVLLSALYLATSCVQHAPEYVPGEAPTGTQVFFPSDVQIGTITLDETKPVIVPVTRVNTSNALTVNIISSADPAFNVPSTVEFAAGAKDATIVINYDAKKFVRGDNYTISLTLGNETTPYGASTYDITLYVNPWGTIGTVSYTDGGWYEETYTVELQYSAPDDKYRLIDLWGTGVNWDFKIGVSLGDGFYSVLPGSGIKLSNGYYRTNTGLVHPSYGAVFTYDDHDPEYTYFSNMTNDGKFKVGSKMTIDRQWRVSAGSFGWYTDTMVITSLE